MPIEIREIIIKTEVVSPNNAEDNLETIKKIKLLKKEIIKECISLIKDNATNAHNSR